MTKNSTIHLAATIEAGLLAIQPSDTAFHARSPGPSSTPAPHPPPPCKWCVGKGRTEEAKTHILEHCTGLDVEEFAGGASSSNSMSSDPADHFWIPDSGATSNMTSHKEWIVDYVPLKVPICLGDDSVVYSAGVGKVWFQPMLSGQSAPLVCLSRVPHVPPLKYNLLSITYFSTQQ